MNWIEYKFLLIFYTLKNIDDNVYIFGNFIFKILLIFKISIILYFTLLFKFNCIVM